MADMGRLQKLSTTIIILIVFVILFESLDFAQYRNYHKRDNGVSGEQVFLSEAEVKQGPLSESWIINMIDRADKRAWIAVYTFTLPHLRESLLRAQKRGVDVRIIFEKFPYGNTSINRETQIFLEKNMLPFHQSGENQFAFMHAKYAIIDDEWILETANWTRASFSSNREFFIRGHDTLILENLSSIFSLDFGGGVGNSSDIRLLAGPTNARERLLLFTNLTEKTVDIYAPSFSDTEMLEKLSQLCREGKSIRILLANYDDREKVEYGTCIEVHRMKKPLHAKAIIRDKRAAFVGSFNYTKNSLERNREIGLFVSGEIAKSISQSFESDWKQSEVALR